MIRLRIGAEKIFGVSRDDLESFLERNVLHVATRFKGMVENKAISELNSTKEAYLDGVYLKRDGDASYSVGINKDNFLANAIEGGVSPYDMKVNLLSSPKAKTGKNGSKYIDIPITTKFNSSLVAKRFDVGDFMTKKNLPARNVKARGLRKAIRRGGKEIYGQYRHKESPLVRGTVASKTGQKGTALVFRRVSTNSDPMAFINKGLRKRNFFKKSLSELKAQLKWEY